MVNRFVDGFVYLSLIVGIGVTVAVALVVMFG